MSRATTSGKVLLIANNFPPVRGGSAVVYDNMARAAGTRVDVLASRINYIDGTFLIGWREHDRRAAYTVHRLRLLRTLLPSRTLTGWDRLHLRARDLAIRARLLATVALLHRRERYAAICLGELLASGWLIRVLRRLLRVRVIVYVHGEEITTRNGHYTALGLPAGTWIDWRYRAAATELTVRPRRGTQGGCHGRADQPDLSRRVAGT